MTSNSVAARSGDESYGSNEGTSISRSDPPRSDLVAQRKGPVNFFIFHQAGPPNTVSSASRRELRARYRKTTGYSKTLLDSQARSRAVSRMRHPYFIVPAIRTSIRPKKHRRQPDDPFEPPGPRTRQRRKLPVSRQHGYRGARGGP